MVLIPKMNPIKDALDSLPVNQDITYKIVIENPERKYMGMSGAGHKCLRYLQYTFRDTFDRPIHSARIQRLFNQGHLLEEVMRVDLQRIGANVTDVQAEIIGFAGHWKGHIDGQVNHLPNCEKTDHLWECKTHNEKNFNLLVKSQSVYESFPEHYDQMMTYMGGRELARGLYTGINKNTNDIYVERIYFNQERYDELQHKMMETIIAENLYDKIGTGKSTWSTCTFCAAKGICHQGVPIKKSCRNCEHSDVLDNGKWECSKGHELEVCEEYELEEILR